MQPPAGDLVARAIRARGGPLEAFTRSSEATLYAGLPGVWRWRVELRGRGSLRLTLVTSGEDQHWVSDGEEARSYLGTALVSREPLAESPLASLARWIELIHLDALEDASRFVWRELPAAGGTGDAARGLTVRCVETDCGEYRLFFDESLRLRVAEGSLEVPTLGSRRVRARFDDFRRRQGLELPFRAHYTSDGQPLLDERVLELAVGRD